jgi:GntR family L-lactate dehydrogenase operon transcriptional regulator
VRTTIQRLDEDRARRERSMRLPLDAAPALLSTSDLIRKT